MRYTYLFIFYFSKIICKRPKVNKERTDLLTIMNNVKVFPRFDGIGMQIQPLDNFSFYQGTDKPKGIGSVETFKSSIYNTSDNIKSQIKT